MQGEEGLREKKVFEYTALLRGSCAGTVLTKCVSPRLGGWVVGWLFFRRRQADVFSRPLP